MTRMATAILLGSVLLAGCDKQWGRQETNQPQIRVVGDEQKQLHQLDAFNLAIGLKRAIYDAGYSCKKITDAGFVGTALRLRQRQLSGLGDFRRAGRERAGARLQGCTVDGPAAVRDQAAPEGQLHLQEIGAPRLSSDCTGEIPYTRRSPPFP